MSNYYHNKYFNSKIFNYNYKAIADAIVKEYAPKSLIEFGCGNGDLSKAIAAKGVQVIALDGYSEPDFTGHDKILFYKVDLNDPAAVSFFINSLQTRFDVAVCMEVAEHLKPEVSASLVDAFTKVTDVIVFSAAIPEQDGDGHINCRSRSSWNQFFEDKKFYMRDTIRKQLRPYSDVGMWYRLNTVDYVKKENGLTTQEYHQLVQNLIESESEASSYYYKENRVNQFYETILNLDIVKAAYSFRRGIKKMIGRPMIDKP